MSPSIKIDLLHQTYERPQKRTSFLFGKIFALVGIFVFATLGTFSLRVTSGNDQGLSSFSIISTIHRFVQAGDRKLKGEDQDRVNFLLLGIGGEGHEGPQLTDTIIFGGYKPSTGSVGLLSIPRDLSVPMGGYGWRKINSANAYGEAETKGAGPKKTISIVEDILDQKIQYYVRIDFDGFAKFIDAIDGIDVYVDRAFTDAQYPIYGKEETVCAQRDADAPDTTTGLYDCRFEALSFKQGWTRMDGDMALKFVRSRHGSNGEASDFARSRRQQKVLTAVKEKIFSVSTLINPLRINELFSAIRENVATNIEPWEILRMANILSTIDRSAMITRVLDASPSAPLYSTIVNGGYVLLPKNDDWEPIRAMAESLLSNETDSSPLSEKPIRIEIQNGTAIPGLAAHAAALLETEGYTIANIGNAAAHSSRLTRVYDFTNGLRREELAALRKFLEANVSLSASGWLLSGNTSSDDISLTDVAYQKLATEQNIDFLVILGDNAASLLKK